MWKNSEVKIGTVLMTVFFVINIILLHEVNIALWKKIIILGIPIFIYGTF